jgi:hypothetical protein
MSGINWDEPFQIDLTAPGLGTIPISAPTYGNFGGPLYSAGVFVNSPDPARPDPVPVDALDEAFQEHDAAFDAATTSSEQSAADLALIQRIQATDLGGIDAEASLYGGAAALVTLEQMAVRGDLALLPPEALTAVTGDALQNIGDGLAGLSANDLMDAFNWMAQLNTGWLFS